MLSNLNMLPSIYRIFFKSLTTGFIKIKILPMLLSVFNVENNGVQEY